MISRLLIIKKRQMKFTVKINSILHAPLPSHVNVVNLQRMADHIRTVSQEMFGMSFYRADDDFFRHECNSVGCIIGHCRQLDTLINCEAFLYECGFNYYSWSESFTGIQDYSYLWRYLFKGEWQLIDNTPKGAAARIEYVIKNGLPQNWREQMNGKAPLSYATTIV